jgi:hypothetical protein
MIIKIITGEEKLVCYRHKIAVLFVVTLALWLLRQPILPYLDVMILVVGLFLACGRMGCFMVGCCHGRPSRWGVCYREEHAASGFTPCFVGVRLFPIQLVESLWCLIIVTVGSAFVLIGSAPGEVLAWYVVTYSGGRFFFEFMRGDHEHSYPLGFSKPQWTSLVIILALVAVELSGVLKFHLWHMGVIVSILLVMIVLILERHFERTNKHQLPEPRHLKEIAEAVNQVSKISAVSEQNSTTKDIHIDCTSFGIQISASKIKDATGDIEHYAFSSQNGNMSEDDITTLAGLIIKLKHPSGRNELIKGNLGVFHLLIHRTDKNVASTKYDNGRSAPLMSSSGAV